MSINKFISLPQTLLRLIDARTFTFFLSVGALSAISYFVSFALIDHLAHVNYKIGVSLAYVISVLVHFTGNRILTFQSHGSDFARHIVRYLSMVILNYLITLIIMHIVVSDLHITPYFGITCSIAATVGSGYLLAKFWVFTKATRGEMT